MRHQGILFKTTMALAVAASMTGCADLFGPIVDQYPALGPLLGPRAKPAPFELKAGNIRGYVYGADGKTQPIPLAFVTTGSISTKTGNPTEPAVASADELVGPNADKKSLSVMHDFGDGAGEVLAERIKRNKAGGPNKLDEFVYVHAGEFFLEGVPEGIATLQASFGNVVSSQTQVTVFPKTTFEPVYLNLYMPQPVRIATGAPNVVEWLGLSPETGITVEVQKKQAPGDAAGAPQEISVTYKPSPPDAAVTLAAPPGSKGAIIRAIKLTYSWSTQTSTDIQQMQPVTFPIPPVVISPAQDNAFGPPVVITVPVGSSMIKSIFEGKDPPGLIVAKMEFLDDQGFSIQDKPGQTLVVSTVLRQL